MESSIFPHFENFNTLPFRRRECVTNIEISASSFYCCCVYCCRYIIDLCAHCSTRKSRPLTNFSNQCWGGLLISLASGPGNKKNKSRHVSWPSRLTRMSQGHGSSHVTRARELLCGCRPALPSWQRPRWTSRYKYAACARCNSFPSALWRKPYCDVSVCIVLPIVCVFVCVRVFHHLMYVVVVLRRRLMRFLLQLVLGVRLCLRCGVGWCCTPCPVRVSI